MNEETNMSRVDWSYHRPGWKTCGKTQEFLANAKIETAEEVNAKTTTLQRDDALALLKKVNKVYAAKGKKVVYFDLKKDKPGDEELAKVLLGPTGNLRAPTLRKGKTLVVGFNEETYEKVFGWLF
jgi:arsenate reductase-like glutaredoxin family protein